MSQRSLLLRQQLRESIQSDIQDRTDTHQAKIAALKTRHATAFAALAADTEPPAQTLALLSHGDSWFNYPLTGNGLPFTDTDIIAQLQTMGTINPAILNVSHYGDATTEEMSVPKQERMIQALQDPSNWLNNALPDAILFSGGGNDIAGNQFCIFLNFAAAAAPPDPTTALNEDRFAGVLGMVEASYKDLFAFRDKFAHGVPIFTHSYDFPIPNGNHPLCAGPWLRPSLHFSGWNDVAQNTAILHQALDRFKTLLQNLAADPANNLILIDTQGTLTTADWANELHPHPDGFAKLAAKFVAALRLKFPGRI